MSTTNLDEVTSVCTTPKDLIKSRDFIRGLEIVLQQVKTFNKDYILGLFTKLQNDEVLDDEEKEELLKFVSDDKVARKGQELLSKLKSVSVNIKTNNLSELNSFTDLLNSIFADDGYKKVQGYIGEVADIAKLTLNTYEGMDKLNLTLPDGEKKEIYIMKTFLTVDDSILTYILSNGVLSNFPEDKVKANPLLITKNKYGEYHFGHTALVEEAKKLGMRLPTDEEMDSPEFNKYFVENTTEFSGCRYRDGVSFGNRGVYSYSWGASTVGGGKASYMGFGNGDSEAYRTKDDKTYGFPGRLVKD